MFGYQQHKLNSASVTTQNKTVPFTTDNRPVAVQQRQIIQKQANKTGLPNNLKSGIENLSGYSMDDVRVHYNSSKPAQMSAHAYAQGTNIHVASGQEKHLPHEAWHVVQQKQGRVKPTKQLKGNTNINDNTGLEREADVMGARAMSMGARSNQLAQLMTSNFISQSNNAPVQRMVGLEFETSKVSVTTETTYKDTLGVGDGFKVEGDNGNLEIVTNPFPTTLEGKKGLVQSVKKAVSFVRIFNKDKEKDLSKAKTRDSLPDIAWTEASHKAKIKRKEINVTCHPQATMGIPLTKMAKMYETISKETPEFNKLRRGGMRNASAEKQKLPHFAMDQRGRGKWQPMKVHMRTALKDAKDSIGKLKKKLKVDQDQDTEMLYGLLTQINTSINTVSDQAFMDGAGWNAHNVGKNQFVALPKTKLHHLYKLMSRQERLIFVNWVETEAQNKDKEIFYKITIEDWLTNIYNPSKGLELATFDEQIEGLGSKEYEANVAPDRTLKSMTDNLGSPTNIGNSKEDKDESGGIFEFRHLKAEVPLKEWTEVADEAMTLAIWLENNAKIKANKPKEEDAFEGFDIFNE